MGDPEDLTFSRLELCSYRYLQQLAKSMELPSNVKKVHLIEMIRAKKYCSPEHLNGIVSRVKRERKQAAQAKKRRKKNKRVQGTEISSTSASHSPPISVTPKPRRSSEYNINYTPDLRQIMKYQPRPNLLRPTLLKRTESDRVLRSFHNKMRQNYNLMNISNSLMTLLQNNPLVRRPVGDINISLRQVQEPLQRLDTNRYLRQPLIDCQSQGAGIESVVPRPKPMITNVCPDDRQLVPVGRSSDVTPPPRPAIRQRRISGIYPLNPPDKAYYHCTPSLFRCQDGKVTKINALVQKPMQRQVYSIQDGNTTPQLKQYVQVTSTAPQMRTVCVRNWNAEPQPRCAQDGNAKPQPRCARDGNAKPQPRPMFNVQDKRPQVRVEYVLDETRPQSRVEYVRDGNTRPQSRQMHDQDRNTTPQPKHMNAQYRNIAPQTRQMDVQYRNTTSQPRQMYPRERNKTTQTRHMYAQDRNITPQTRQIHGQYRNTTPQPCQMYPHERNKTTQTRHMYAQDRNAKPQTWQMYAQDGNTRPQLKQMFNIQDGRQVVDLPGNTIPQLNSQSPKIPLTETTQDMMQKNIVTVQDVIDYKVDRQIFTIPETAARQHLSMETINSSTPNVNTQKESRIYEENSLNNRSTFAQKDARTYEENPTDNREYSTQNDKQRNIRVYGRNSLGRNSSTPIVDSGLSAENPIYSVENRDSSTQYDYANDPRISLEHQNHMSQIVNSQNIDYRNPSIQNEDSRINLEYQISLQNATETQNPGLRDTETSYPNMSALTDIYPNNPEPESMNKEDSFSVYYHKKIRAEQVRSQRFGQREHESLPRINEVFSQFSDEQYRKLTQPLYVQVSEESERVPPHLNNTPSMLESLYNFKHKFVSQAHEPLLQMVPATNTQCVFSSHTVTTAIAQTPEPACDDYAHPYQRANQYQYSIESESMPRLYDYLRMAEREPSPQDFRCDEVLNSSHSSFGTPASQQEPGANVTIPEMVEDALELISQDGDYMERIGMDEKMHCILCDWAGPTVMLEYHIKKEHQLAISPQDSTEWHITFTLGSLVTRDTWLSKVLVYKDTVYVVSAKYRDDDCFMAAISVLSSNIESPKRAVLTVYNKVTGEPHIFDGEITQLPETLPYHTDSNCLKLDITSLNLLPNSANLKLINRELVANSPSKVVVGQPELDSIEIGVFVKVFDV